MMDHLPYNSLAEALERLPGALSQDLPYVLLAGVFALVFLVIAIVLARSTAIATVSTRIATAGSIGLISLAVLIGAGLAIPASPIHTGIDRFDESSWDREQHRRDEVTRDWNLHLEMQAACVAYITDMQQRLGEKPLFPTMTDKVEEFSTDVQPRFMLTNCRITRVEPQPRFSNNKFIGNDLHLWAAFPGEDSLRYDAGFIIQHPSIYLNRIEVMKGEIQHKLHLSRIRDMDWWEDLPQTTATFNIYYDSVLSVTLRYIRASTTDVNPLISMLSDAQNHRSDVIMDICVRQKGDATFYVEGLEITSGRGSLPHNFPEHAAFCDPLAVLLAGHFKDIFERITSS